jgi:hypothetical protein
VKRYLTSEPFIHTLHLPFTLHLCVVVFILLYKPKRAHGVINDELARAQQTAEAETSRKRIANSGLTMRLSGNCLQALRDRILSAEAYPERTDSDELLSELFASATVQPVTSDRLEPAQLQQLQQLVHAYHDRISWSSDDIGCLHEKYKDFYMRIPTEPGARCKQKPYRLSLKEQEAFKRQLAVLLEQGIVRRASGPTDFLSPVLFVPKP